MNLSKAFVACLILLCTFTFLFFACAESEDDDNGNSGGSGSDQCDLFCQQIVLCETDCISENCAEFCDEQVTDAGFECLEQTTCDMFNDCICSMSIDDDDDDNLDPEVVLFEDWESAEIDSGLWELFGSPTPVISTVGHASDYSLDVNGDDFCESTAASVETFKLTPGTEVKVTLRCNKAEDENQRIYFGFGPESPVTEDQDPDCAGEVFAWEVVVGFEPQYALVQSYTLFEDGNEQWWGEPFSLWGTWHQFNIFVNDDLTLTYQMDGTEFLTTFNTIDPNKTRRFIMTGRSLYGEAVIDNISIKQIQR